MAKSRRRSAFRPGYGVGEDAIRQANIDIERAVEAAVTKALSPGVASMMAASAAGGQGGRSSSTATMQMLNALASGLWPSNAMPRDPRNLTPFGPLNPLSPDGLDAPRRDTGRPEPRLSEYDVGWNIPGAGQRHIPWHTLRAAVAPGGVDLMRRCIEVRKRDIRALKWAWTVSDDAVNEAYQADPTRGKSDIAAELRTKWAPEIARLTAFWERPWRSQRLDFGAWVNAVIEEYVVLDALAIYPRTTYGGELVALEILDGSTIKPLLDWRGATPEPPYPAYQQILYGFPRGEWLATVEEDDAGNLVAAAGTSTYLADQLFYHRENYRSFSPYGFSPTEQALVAARLWLKRQGWMLSEYDDGTMPLGLLELPDAAPITPREREEYEASINDELTGQTAARHRLKALFPGMKPTLLPSVDERYKPDYDLFLIKLLSSFYGVTASRLGFSEAKGLGSSGMHQAMQQNTEDLGTAPDIEILTNLVMTLSRDYLRAPREVAFTFVDPTKDDQQVKATIAVGKLQSGQATLNETRIEDGKAPYTFAEADMPYIQGAAGPVFLEGSSQPAPTVNAQGTVIDPNTGQPAAGQDDSSNDDSSNDDSSSSDEHANKAAELAAYRRFTRRGSSRPFTWHHHTSREVADIVKASVPDIPSQRRPDPSESAQPPPPDHRWPAWAVDSLLAAYVADRLTGVLPNVLDLPAIAAAWEAATAHWQPGDLPLDAAKWMAAHYPNALARLVAALLPILMDGATVAASIGVRSAQAALAADLSLAGSSTSVDWSAFVPGDVRAARLVLDENPAAQLGLSRLLDEYGVRITSIAQNRLDEVAAVLADGLEEGRTPAEIGRALRGVLDDPAWAQMTAWTETNRVQSMAALDQYRSVGTEGKRWFTARDQRVCPVCELNDESSPILLEDPFPSGTPAPPAHPRCRCAVLPVRIMPTADKSARALATGNEGNAERLHRYWTRGKGLAKWADSPHPFRTLREHLARFEPFTHDLDYLNRTTAQWYHDALGTWPGRQRGGVHV